MTAPKEVPVDPALLKAGGPADAAYSAHLIDSGQVQHPFQVAKDERGRSSESLCARGVSPQPYLFVTMGTSRKGPRTLKVWVRRLVPREDWLDELREPGSQDPYGAPVTWQGREYVIGSETILIPSHIAAPFQGPEVSPKKERGHSSRPAARRRRNRSSQGDLF